MRALVTGVARGLGAAITKDLAARGLTVIGTARGDVPPDIAGSCEHIVRLDLSDRSSISAALDALHALAEPIDLLVNNAGLDGRAVGGGEHDRGPLEIDPDVFMRQIEVNTLGPLLLSRGLIDLLRATEAPRIVNVSSQLGHPEVVLRAGRDVGYNASKAALTTTSATLARDLPDVTVVAVHPGWVRTDMGGPEAALSVEDSAARLVDAMLALQPEQSGQFLDVDGNPFRP